MKRFLYILLLIAGFELYSQNEAFNWVFGNYTGVTFDTPNGEPKSLDEIKFYSFEGCASISDSLGRLLFYTNGSNIYDNKGRIVNANNKMLGDFHSTQSAIIIKQPEQENIYFIFTTDAGLYADSINNGLNLSIVRSDAVSTELIEINRNIASNTAEKLAACYHSNGRDVWIVAREANSNSFIANLLTKDGITKSVVSKAGAVQKGDSNLVIGYMKIAPRGDKIAVNCVTNNYSEIFKFDNENGVVSNPITINLANRVANYGLEFSPAGKFLYICDANEGVISQFDVSEHNQSKIQNSERIIAKEKEDLGALQLAPNGKIYIANLNSAYLSEIQFPDKQGDECNYIPKSVLLNGFPEKFASYGLPNFNSGLFDFNLEIEDNEFCVGQTISLGLRKFPAFKNTKYLWTGPKNFKSQSRDLNLKNAQADNQGWYYLLAEYYNFSVYDSVYIKIIDVPDVKIIKSGDFSSDGFIFLKASNVNNVAELKWSTGENALEIKVGNAGKYFLYAFNELGCFSVDSIEISAIKESIRFIKYDSLLFDDICFGGSLIRDIRIENFGSQTILINDISFNDANSEFQVLNKNQVIGAINVGSQKLIRIRFYSGIPGNFKKNLRINTGFGNEIYVFESEIAGKAYSKLKIWIPFIQENAGKKVDVPIFAKLDCYEGVDLIADLNFDIKFHKDVFFPEKAVGTFSKSLIQDSFNVNINLRNVKLSEKMAQISAINGWVLTGNFEPDSLVLSNVGINHTNVEIIQENGSLEVTGCADDLRPVKLMEETAVMINPNPATDAINLRIFTKEKGQFRLKILSLEGTVVDEIYFVSNNDLYDEIIQRIPTANISSGIYSAILDSPSKTIVKQIIIMK